MKLTREHKVLLGVVGAGVLALGVDRFVLSDSATAPQTAAADDYAIVPHGSAASPAPVRSDTANPAPPAAPVARTGPTIAQSLRTTRGRHAAVFARARDAFVIPPGWLGPAAAAAPPIAPQAENKRVELFLKQHKLAAVMNNHIAIVNSTPCRVGDTIDGALLVKLDRAAATFELDGVTFQITLANEAP